MSGETPRTGESDRRGFLRRCLTGLAAVAVGGTAAAAARRSRRDDFVWQLDPHKCTQCGRCATQCVLTPSAVKCVHAYDLCWYCDLCGGYHQPYTQETDTAAEHQVAGPPAGCENTTTVFSLAARGGIEAVVIRERADEAWRKVEAPPDVRKRVDENLAAGHVVVLPGRAVEKRLGWWRVDPRTGTTVGVMDEGFRQTTERVELEGVPDNTAISGTRIRGVGVKDYPAFWSRQFARDILESRGWTADHPNYMEALEKVVDLQQYILEKGFGGIF